MNSMINWLDNRTGFRELMHEALYERVPGGARWRYVWGSTLVFTFTLQMITGFGQLLNSAQRIFCLAGCRKRPKSS